MPRWSQSAPKWQKKWWHTKNVLLAHWFGKVKQMILSYFWAKTKIWTFLPRVRVRQNDRKNDGVPKNVYWPIGLKMFHKWFWATFERKLKFEHFCPGEVIVRQNDIKKLWRTKRFLLAHWFGNVPQMILSYFWAKTKIWKFLPRWSQSAPKWHGKIMAYQKIFIGPLVWKCSTNNFELLLSEN